MNIKLKTLVPMALMIISLCMVNSYVLEIKSPYRATTYALRVLCFSDINKDTYYQNGEPPVAGIKISIDKNHTSVDLLGNPIPTIITDSTGGYTYDMLGENRLYVFNFENNKDWKFEDYVKTLDAEVRPTVPSDGLKAEMLLIAKSFQVPMLPTTSFLPSQLSLQLFINNNDGSGGSTTVTQTSAQQTTAQYATASSSTAYGGTKNPKMGLYGFYFIDNNNNGEWDDGESAFPGITTYIYDWTGFNPQGQNSSPIATPTQSASNGRFLFDNLRPNYYYQLVALNPANYVFGKIKNDFVCRNCVRPTQASDGSTSDYIGTLPAYMIPLVPKPGVAANSSKIPFNSFLTYPGDTNQVPVPNPPKFAVTLDGFVFYDKNNDGFHQGGYEFGVPGAMSTIMEVPGNVTPPIGFSGSPVSPVPTTSSEQGWYRYDDLIPGHTYVIRLTNPAGYRFGNVYPDYSCNGCVRVPTQYDQPIKGKYIITLPIFKTPLRKSENYPAGVDELDFYFYVPPIEGGNSAPITLYPTTMGSPSGGVSTATLIPTTATATQTGPVMTVNPTNKPTLTPTGDNTNFPTTIASTISTNVPTGDNTYVQTSQSSATTAPPSTTGASTATTAGPSTTTGASTATTAAPSTTGASTATTASPSTTTATTATTTPTTTPVTNSGAVTTNLFVDKNGNGIRDIGEPAIPNAVVYLLDKDGNPARDNNGNLIPPSTSDTNGKVTFQNVPNNQPYYLYIKPIPDGLVDPGPIGPFKIPIDGLTRPTVPSDGVVNPTITPLGEYGLFPKGPVGSGDIGGTVFYDPNFNSIQDGGEPGVPGIQVLVYSPVYGYPIASTVTDANGKWKIPGLNSNITYRIEYIVPNDIVSTGSSLVRFVNGGTANLLLGLVYTNQTGSDKGNNFPKSFATTCFVKGANNGPYRDHTTVAAFYSNAVGKGYEDSGSAFIYKMATHGQVGAVNGIAFDPKTGDTFVSAYHKTGSDIGPYGTGAIYKINSNLGITVYANLNALYGTQYCGPYSHSFDYRERDVAGPWVGKIAFGEMIATNDYLYVTNLFRNDIVSIPLRQTPTATNVVAINVPNPGCSVANDWHIFPVTIYQNELYTGGVCAGELGSTLSTYILKFDRASKKFINVLSFTMNYARGCRYLDNFGNCVGSQWTRWTTTDTAQPMLTSIIFDDLGHLVMGFKDRSGDIGSTVSAPDMLVACLSPSGYYFLENNGVCGGVLGSSPNQKSMTGLYFGPGGGQYFDVKKPGIHDYVSSFAAVKGGPQVIVTTGFDMYETYEGSVRWYNSTTGRVLKGFSLYLSVSSKAPTFGKANGLGDITAIYDNSMEQYQVGRIWWDTNFNGIQDANEPGVSNMTVYLMVAGSNNPVAIVNSDANGYTLFNVQQNTQYICVITAANLQKLGKDILISPKNVDSSRNGEMKDSDGQLVNGNLLAAFQSKPFGGYYFDNCHFGIKDKNAGVLPR